MDDVTQELWKEKKASLAKGDAVSVSQAKEGKDLMSVLREPSFAPGNRLFTLMPSSNREQ